VTDQPRFNRARNPRRARYDEATVHAILDAGMVGHVGFITDGRPMVMPMAYARDTGCIWLHGASKARIVKLADGAQLTMTARSSTGSWWRGRGSTIRSTTARQSSTEPGAP
jgi:nitroimidazol reductase NimA-like FMN-containing flavoprotein (pyridoxamine 5'-phosphate oxidase superfamily)